MRSRAISGKVVVVTGGLRGIGKATAAALARAGASVAVGDIDIPSASASNDEPTAALCAPLDVSDADEFAQFLDMVETRLGPLDILVNNAGIMPTGFVEDEEAKTTERTVLINLVGTINGTKEAIRRMKPRGRGHIVNISSLTARVPGAGVATYSATKAGVLTFCEATAMELAGTGIDLTVIQPSLVRTELVSGISGRDAVLACGPEDVAKRVVDLVKRPQFQAFVPRAVGVAAFANQTMPARARHKLAHATKTDRLIADLDRQAHASYDERMRRAVLRAVADEDRNTR